MFGNRAVSVQLTKIPQAGKNGPDGLVEVSRVDIDKISDLALVHTQNIAKIAGTAYIAKRLLDTACDIAIIVAKHKLK